MRSARWPDVGFALVFLSLFPLCNANAQMCVAPTNLSCQSDCSTNQLHVTWTNATTYTGIVASVEGLNGGTLNQSSLGGSDQSLVVPGLSPDVYTVTLTVICAAGGTAEKACSVMHAPYGGTGYVDFVWAPEGVGSVDSAAALYAALAWQGLQPILIDDLVSYACFGAGDPTSVVWVCLGTFPNHHVLTASEGAALASLVQGGTAVYVEGSEVWTGPPTLFTAMDGVDNAQAASGDDSLSEIELIPFDCYADLPDTAAYLQDSVGGNDSTDRAVVLPEHGAFNAVALFQNSVDDVALLEAPYAVTVLQDYMYSGPGNTITSSWEFGGYGGDQNELAFALRQQLSTFVVIDLQLLPGDCNGDGVVNIADPISALIYLFNPTVTSLACAQACDSNMDGSIDIADPIHLLGQLFGSGGSVTGHCIFVSCSFDLDCDIVNCP